MYGKNYCTYGRLFSIREHRVVSGFHSNAITTRSFNVYPAVVRLVSIEFFIVKQSSSFEASGPDVRVLASYQQYRHFLRAGRKKLRPANVRLIISLPELLNQGDDGTYNPKCEKRYVAKIHQTREHLFKIAGFCPEQV